MKSVQIRSFSGPFFSVFGLNIGKYGPEKTLYLDTFYAVILSGFVDTKYDVINTFLLSHTSYQRLN